MGYKQDQASPTFDKLLFNKVRALNLVIRLIYCVVFSSFMMELVWVCGFLNKGSHGSLLMYYNFIDGSWNLQVRMGLGGRVRLVISGAAPLSGHVEQFLRVIMCSPVLQGYGKHTLYLLL